MPFQYDIAALICSRPITFGDKGRRLILLDDCGSLYAHSRLQIRPPVDWGFDGDFPPMAMHHAVTNGRGRRGFARRCGQRFESRRIGRDRQGPGERFDLQVRHRASVLHFVFGLEGAAKDF